MVNPILCFTEIGKVSYIGKKMYRFLHPLTYGEYPRTMQENVGERLPKFTPEEVAMVKGSYDYLGVNQYTSYYMFDPPWPQFNISSYANDWDVGYACKSLLPNMLVMALNLLISLLINYDVILQMIVMEYQLVGGQTPDGFTLYLGVCTML